MATLIHWMPVILAWLAGYLASILWTGVTLSRTRTAHPIHFNPIYFTAEGTLLTSRLPAALTFKNLRKAAEGCAHGN